MHIAISDLVGIGVYFDSFIHDITYNETTMNFNILRYTHENDYNSPGVPDCKEILVYLFSDD
jgi:hypothetical protein